MLLPPMSPLALASLLLLLGGPAEPPPQRECREHPAVRPPCFTVHGRLRAYASGPPVNAIWIVGTSRMLGVSGGQALPEFQQLPANVRALLREGTDVFGDFEFCPFTPERPRTMRMGCIQAGRHLRTKPAR